MRNNYCTYTVSGKYSLNTFDGLDNYMWLQRALAITKARLRLHRSARFCCWKAMGRFRSNFWRKIQIRNQNQPITSGFWNIWGYVLEKWGFSLLLRLCTGRKIFFWFFSQMSSFSTTLSLQNELLKSHERFFFYKDTAISSFDIYPNNLMSIHIDSLVHTILNSKIYLGFDPRHWIYHLGNGNVNLATPFS